jgi:DNA-binding MarR family transcriptional regulator
MKTDHWQHSVAKAIPANPGFFISKKPMFQFLHRFLLKKYLAASKLWLILDSCINNYMPNNQFKKGELYSFVTGKASTAIARRLQKKFNNANLNITIEQWSVLYHLWKQDGISQQELCNATYRDKPSITRLVDNLEKLDLVKRVASDTDRRINKIYVTKHSQKLQEETMTLAEETLNEALETVPPDKIEVCKEVLKVVYDNLK